MIDFQEHNLHVLNYSVPIHETLPLAELKKHLFTLPDKPDLIPYRTSYYKETWGFCLRHRTLESLPEGEYEVLIDSTLADGSLTYGECLLPGDSEREVLLSTHVCHPSLCNDNLSGIAVMTELARELQARPRRRYSYRFLFIPGTIGSITWLARNEVRIDHGLVAANLGDAGTFHYKRSRRGNRGDRSRRLLRSQEAPESRSASRISSPSAMTSGNTARRASTSRWDRSPAPPTAAIPSTTPRRTISISSAPRRWKARSAPISR